MLRILPIYKIGAIKKLKDYNEPEGVGNIFPNSKLPSRKISSTTLLIVAGSNRPDYLQKTLSYVGKYHPK